MGSRDDKASPRLDHCHLHHSSGLLPRPRLGDHRNHSPLEALHPMGIVASIIFIGVGAGIGASVALYLREKGIL